MNINNLPILLEIALKDRIACQLLCQASKEFYCKVYSKDTNSYYNILFTIHGERDWHNQCRRGNLRAVKWLHGNNISGCDKWAMNYAAKSGSLELVQWLHHNRNEGCSNWAMDLAAAKGHFEVMQWLHNNRREGCTPKAKKWAARNGHLHVLYWLHVFEPTV